MQYFFGFVLNIINGWGAVDFRIFWDFFGPKYHGYSISSHSYEFFLHLAQLDNFDFTMSKIQLIYHDQYIMWKNRGGIMVNVSPRDVPRPKTRRAAGPEGFWPWDILRENIFTIIP